MVDIVSNVSGMQFLWRLRPPRRPRGGGRAVGGQHLLIFLLTAAGLLVDLVSCQLRVVSPGLHEGQPVIEQGMPTTVQLFGFWVWEQF